MNPKQFSHRIGNVEDRLVQQAQKLPDYGRHRKGLRVKRVLTLAAVIVLMACSFTVGAMARTVPEPETVVFESLGVTMVLPDSWKDQYGVEMGEDGKSCGVYVKSIHESDGDWHGAGYLFWFGEMYHETMTPAEVDEISPVAFQYVFATEGGTYLLCYASDVQWDPGVPEQEELYYRMQAETRDIRFILDNAAG